MPEPRESMTYGEPERVQIQTPARYTAAERAAAAGLPPLHSANPRMRRVLTQVRSLARVQATVLIQGESGTGKEVIARALHAHGRRPGRPFVSVNCAALPDGLLESELFGHERGAFTGATRQRPGKFELAAGGTIFLDEVGAAEMRVQARLLRVLQEREFELVGGTTTLPVDVRIVATSNRNIKEEVRKGNFREDLYFRLNVVPVHVPPLRERREDVPDLTAHFIRLSAIENGVPEPQLPPAVLAELMRLPWPGNVRQLQNTVERAVVLARGERLGMEDFLLEEEVLRTADAAPGFDQDMTLKEMEKRMILATLSRFRENRTQAARHLGISVRTLRNKLNLYRQQSRSATA